MTDTQNRRMVLCIIELELEEALKIIQFPHPAMGRDTVCWNRLLRAPPHLALNTATDQQEKHLLSVHMSSHHRLLQYRWKDLILFAIHLSGHQEKFLIQCICVLHRPLFKGYMYNKIHLISLALAGALEGQGYSLLSLVLQAFLQVPLQVGRNILYRMCALFVCCRIQIYYCFL